MQRPYSAKLQQAGVYTRLYSNVNSAVYSNIIGVRALVIQGSDASLFSAHTSHALFSEVPTESSHQLGWLRCL